MEQHTIISPIIETHELSRDYKKVRAVDTLDLSIQPGELFGLVGPDGAGKTTTLRLLAGLLYISSGSAKVAGFDLKSQSEAIKPNVGYMAQQFSLYGELSVLENLTFFADLYNVPSGELSARMDNLLTFAGLTEFKERRAAHLSGGMQKKLALACTLIHEPPILLLDEPTTGVDPVSRREFWDILTDLYLEGTTIIVSTPYMDEADRCSRVGLMYAGKMVVCASPQEIRAGLQGDLIQLRPDDWRAARAIAADLPGVLEVQTYGELLHLLVDSAEERQPEIESALKECGIGYSGFRQAPVRMEEAFISLIQTDRGLKCPSVIFGQLPRKEIQHILRDRMTFFLVIMTPVVLFFIFSYSLAVNLEHIPIAVLDYDRSQTARAFVQQITAGDDLELYTQVNSMGEVEDLLMRGEVKAVLVLDPAFSRDLLALKGLNMQIIIDGTEPESGGLAAEHIGWRAQEYIQTAMAGQIQAMGVAPEALTPIDLRVRTWYNPGLKSANAMIPGILSIILGLPRYDCCAHPGQGTRAWHVRAAYGDASYAH